MVSQSLVLTAVLLFATTAALTRAQVAARPGVSTSRMFRPFCYCPSGFVPHYTWYTWPFCKCYRFVRDLASWAEAKVYCGVMRATMAEDRSSWTHTFLRWKLRSLEMSNHHHLLEKQEYWLGATDLQVESRFVWDPSYTSVSYPTYWMYGNGVPLQEPNNYLGYQNCMAIKRRPFTNKNTYYYDWIDDDCYQKKFYICERRGWYCWGWQCYDRLYHKMPNVDLPRGMTAEKMAVREVQLKREAAQAKAKDADFATDGEVPVDLGAARSG